jgi:hypothetical protein
MEVSKRKLDIRFLHIYPKMVRMRTIFGSPTGYCFYKIATHKGMTIVMELG